MKIYKIRNKQTRLFSTGSCDPKWKKTGKIWKTIGALKNHLNLFDVEFGFREPITATGIYYGHTYYKSIYNNLEEWEIIEYEFVEIIDDSFHWEGKQFIEIMKKQKKDKKDKEDLKRLNYNI